MKQDDFKQTTATDRNTTRRPYTPPILFAHGDLRDVTLGVSLLSGESSSGSATRCIAGTGFCPPD